MACYGILEAGGLMEVIQLELWITKSEVAKVFGCSVRWIERRMEEGLPHAHIAGRAKFLPTEVQKWLIANGYFDYRGDRAA